MVEGGVGFLYIILGSSLEGDSLVGNDALVGNEVNRYH